jgi:argininosuccinate lyase
MYRSRPKGNLDKDVLNFLSSMKDDGPILHYDLVGSQAHSIMLYEMGHLTLTELQKILKSLEEIKENPIVLADCEEFEDIHESIESYVIKKAGGDAGGKMHTARSRNDQVILDIRMKVRDDINNLCLALANLIESLLLKAEEYKDIPMPMYTHTQQAQIGTFSHFLISYTDALFRDMERLYIAYGRINQSPLGACAIGGTSIKIDRKMTAELLGFDSVVRNSIDATSSRDALIEYVGTLSVLATTLGRVAEDFILWSTSEFGYTELADEQSSTSSAMPQKKNPDPLELVRAKSGSVIGSLVRILCTVKGLPSGYSRDLQDIKPAIWQATTAMSGSIKVMEKVVRSIQVNKGRMQDAAKNSYAISLDIAEQLVARKGLAFRTAHKIVGSLVEEAVQKGNMPLAMLGAPDIAQVVKKQGSQLDADELMQIIKEVTPAKSLALRSSLGSPNPKEQEEAIQLSIRSLSGFKTGIQKRIDKVDTAFKSLSDSVQEYLRTS